MSTTLAKMPITIVWMDMVWFWNVRLAFGMILRSRSAVNRKI